MWAAAAASAEPHPAPQALRPPRRRLRRATLPGPADLRDHRAGPRRPESSPAASQVLRVPRQGGTRSAGVPGAATVDALTGYLLLRDREYGDPLPPAPGAPAAPAAPPRTASAPRHDLHQLLRWVAQHAGPPLAEVASRVHPHAPARLRDARPGEARAPVQHVRPTSGTPASPPPRH
ncbi:hypothetical protein HBB16_12065 [Pseudonocardia sp. MCCB 268]|nr:hypothetical protein [Pseudonocardia cytotoxica]